MQVSLKGVVVRNSKIGRMDRTLQLALLAILSAVAFATTGCSDGRPERIRVSGRVMIDGQPLKRGYVKFVPQGARPSIGKLDENGEFILSSYDGEEGVVRGTHRVQVASNKVISPSEIHWYAPQKYSSFRTSGLVVEVDEPTESVAIELTWGEKKPSNGEFLIKK